MKFFPAHAHSVLPNDMFDVLKVKGDKLHRVMFDLNFDNTGSSTFPQFFNIVNGLFHYDSNKIDDEGYRLIISGTHESFGNEEYQDAGTFHASYITVEDGDKHHPFTPQWVLSTLYKPEDHEIVYFMDDVECPMSDKVITSCTVAQLKEMCK